MIRRTCSAAVKLRLFALILALGATVVFTSLASAVGGSVFLTGHDPDFHAIVGANTTGARNINSAAIDFIMDPAFNSFVAGGVTKFLYVQSSITPPTGHTNGKLGINATGYVEGVDYDHHTAATLGAALDQLGTTYSAIVIASDFGGILTQAELDILNARSGDIIGFLNDGGGLYAMAESNSQAGLTPLGGHFGFLPFVVTSTQFNQTEVGVTVTPFGAGLGLADSDVNGNASHNIFVEDAGLNVVDFDRFGNILSIAGRGIIDPSGVFQLSLDIHPTSCPNPLNLQSKGVTPVAVLGDGSLSVEEVDVSTVLLNGVAPIRSEVLDVATPYTDTEPCGCNELGPDGVDDLTLKFSTQDLVATLGDPSWGDEVELTLTGELLSGTEFEISDCVVIRRPPKYQIVAPDLTGPEVFMLTPPGASVQQFQYELPGAADVRLSVYDIQGRFVTTLAEGFRGAGVYAAEWDAAGRPSGIYFYRLETSAETVVGKLVIFR